MSAAFEIIRGDSFSIEVEILDGDGVAVDLTDVEVFFTAKRNIRNLDADADLAIQLTDHSDPTNGKTILSFTPADTNSLKPGTYWWDIQTENEDGSVISTILQTMRVKPDVTRRTEDAS